MPRSTSRTTPSTQRSQFGVRTNPKWAEKTSTMASNVSQPRFPTLSASVPINGAVHAPIINTVLIIIPAS